MFSCIIARICYCLSAQHMTEMGEANLEVVSLNKKNVQQISEKPRALTWHVDFSWNRTF